MNGSGRACLGVEFESGDAELTTWALRPNQAVEGKNRAGDVPGTLPGHGIENTAVLTTVCDGHGNSYELVLQVRAAASTTYGNVVVVRYASDGADGSLSLPDKVVLCVRPETPDCRPPGHGEPG